jgi:hypothetical protein
VLFVRLRRTYSLSVPAMMLTRCMRRMKGTESTFAHVDGITRGYLVSSLTFTCLFLTSTSDVLSSHKPASFGSLRQLRRDSTDSHINFTQVNNTKRT